MPLNPLFVQETVSSFEGRTTILDPECPTCEKDFGKTIVRTEQKYLALLEWEVPEPLEEIVHARHMIHIPFESHRSGFGFYDAAVILLMMTSLAATAACFMQMVH